MKTKLLKKLRKRGRNQVFIHSITKTGETVTGMSYGYNDDKYSGLFCFGDTEDDLKNKAQRIYIEDYISKNKTT